MSFNVDDALAAVRQIKSAFQPVAPPQPAGGAMPAQGAPVDPAMAAQGGGAAPAPAAPPPMDPAAAAGAAPAPPQAAGGAAVPPDQLMAMMQQMADGMSQMQMVIERQNQEINELRQGHQDISNKFAKKEGEFATLIKTIKEIQPYDPMAGQPQMDPMAAAQGGGAPAPAADPAAMAAQGGGAPAPMQ